MNDESAEGAAARLASAVLREGYDLTGLHCYRDRDGVPLYWRIRCTHQDKPKWVRPMHHDGTNYVLGEPVAAAEGKAIYRLPELLAAPLEAAVWVVEGETCADALALMGLVATTSGGAGSAASADWGPLRGRRIRLWPDHDEAGVRYADAVAACLERIKCKVERIDAPCLGLPHRGDCVDWLRSHPMATRADIEALPRTSSTAPSAEDPQVILTLGCDVQPLPVNWLWPGWLAAGKLHLVGGAPGTGKTTLALALAATITRGGQWPDGSVASRGDVVIWSGEDDHADTINPRLRAAGADMRRARVVDGIVERGKHYPFDPAHDMEQLLAGLREIEELRLIVIDPLVSIIPGDSHKNAEVRRGLQPLVDLASELRCAVLGITHFSKGMAGRDPVERITGSIAFGALARVVMVAVHHEEPGGGGERRTLLRAKSNLGPNGSGYGYSMEQCELPDFPGVHASRVVWGDPVEGSARAVLSDAEAESNRRTATVDAQDWLRGILQAGPALAQTVTAAARERGISEKALRTARERLQVESSREGFGPGSSVTWGLPVIPAHACHTGLSTRKASMHQEGMYASQTSE